MPIDLLVGEVNEKASAIATVAFTDENGAGFVPTAVYVRIDCKSTTTAIRAEVEITPAAQTMQIAIPHAENEIHDSTAEFDIHEITVRATYDGTSQTTASGEFKVKNLSFLT